MKIRFWTFQKCIAASALVLLFVFSEALAGSPSPPAKDLNARTEYAKNSSFCRHNNSEYSQQTMEGETSAVDVCKDIAISNTSVLRVWTVKDNITYASALPTGGWCVFEGSGRNRSYFRHIDVDKDGVMDPVCFEATAGDWLGRNGYNVWVGYGEVNSRPSAYVGSGYCAGFLRAGSQSELLIYDIDQDGVVDKGCIDRASKVLWVEHKAYSFANFENYCAHLTARMIVLDGKVGCTDKTENLWIEGNYYPVKDRMPLSTRGKYVVDKFGVVFKFRSVNWEGAHTPSRIPAEIENYSVQRIAHELKIAGFNSVRLTFAAVSAYDPKPVGAGLTFDPVNHPWHKNIQKYWDLTPYEALKSVVKELTDNGIVVILNNHTTGYHWCCNVEDDSSLWFTESSKVRGTVNDDKVYTYHRINTEEITNRFTSTDAWIEMWKKMADIGKDNPLVVGYDLRNEIRWDINRMNQNATWGRWPIKDAGAYNEVYDWRLAAQKAGNALLAIDNAKLIIVEGVNHNSTEFWMEEYPGWKSNRPHLRPMTASDAHLLNVPNKLIYGAHIYPFIGPLELVGARYKTFTEEQLRTVYAREWAAKAAELNTPIMITEFASNWNTGNESSESHWLNVSTQIMKENATAGYQTWSLSHMRNLRRHWWTSHSFESNDEAIFNSDLQVRGDDWRRYHYEMMFPGYRRTQ